MPRFVLTALCYLQEILLALEASGKSTPNAMGLVANLLFLRNSKHLHKVILSSVKRLNSDSFSIFAALVQQQVNHAVSARDTMFHLRVVFMALAHAVNFVMPTGQHKECSVASS